MYNGNKIIEGGVTVAQFKDLWQRLASDSSFKSKGYIWFGLMNGKYGLKL